MSGLTDRLEKVALWFDVRARNYRRESEAAFHTGADRKVYESVAIDNENRAVAICEAIFELKREKE